MKAASLIFRSIALSWSLTITSGNSVRRDHRSQEAIMSTFTLGIESTKSVPLLIIFPFGDTKKLT